MELNINSPKSPYLKLGTKIKDVSSEGKDKLIKIYIE
jgi:hypothetical protein